MILVDFLPPFPDIRWQFARQVGITHAVTKLNPQLTGQNPPWDLDVLRSAQARFCAAGFTLLGLEGDQLDMQRIKEGVPGRDEDLEGYRQMLRNMGQLDIRLLCYNFMARIGWYRTDTAIAARGGALVSGFAAADMEPRKRGQAPFVRSTRRAGSRQMVPDPFFAIDPEPLSEAAVWENYEYFIRQVGPTAAESGVHLALHPDDPPWSPLCGVGRILTTGQGLRRALQLFDDPVHGVTFCQGTCAAMGEDLPALAREFAAAQKLFFVHFRDVRGTAGDFVETFHDDGPTDMPAMLRLYHQLGFAGPIRVDHVPVMAGERNDDPGYGSLGRLFAVGYLKGILDAHRIPYL
jgi:mannonate dehydratase